MKDAILTSVALLLAGFVSSCGPSTYTMAVETREVSQSGLDLMEKSLAVLCVSPEHVKDSSKTYMQTDDFVAALEKEYYGGESSIDIYNVVSPDFESYASKDSLVRYVVETGCDIIFLLQGDRVYVYDSLNPADKVLFYQSPADDARLGERLAVPFKSQWSSGHYSFYFYDNADWLKVSADLVDTYDWNKAIQGWLPYTSSKNLEKRACAEFNIAQACYLIGKIDLAREWLDLADLHFDLVLSPGLRSRLNKK